MKIKSSTTNDTVHIHGQKVIEKFEMLEKNLTDSLEKDFENDHHHNHQFTMTWLTYINNLNSLLKTIQQTPNLFAFERAITSTSNLKKFTDQFWSVYLNHVTYSKNFESIAFTKGSPLLPFFKNVYPKIRQSGTLHRLKQKWKQINDLLKVV